MNNPQAFPSKTRESWQEAALHRPQQNGINPQPLVREEIDHPGMSLRDYFAAKAMNGICSSGTGGDWSDAEIAREAFSIADAMLKAREA